MVPIAQEFIAGETLHGHAKRHDVSRNLIRIWVTVDPDRIATPSTACAGSS
jgi:hypothetical protein